MNNEQIATIELGPIKITLPIVLAKEVAPTSFTVSAVKPPRIGSDWMGGIYAGIIGGKNGACDHHLILLLGDFEAPDWSRACEWAGQQDGSLPTRSEQALLFANLKGEFKPEAYWSCEQYEGNSASAWCQGFGYGYQLYYHKSAALRAVAVRRLPI